jgi:hypothetical protein
MRRGDRVSAHSDCIGPPVRRWFVAIAGMVAVFLSGCAEDIETRYGGRAGASVNGTGVLADMFENAGHQVISRSSLSPGLHETADVIVWFPDDFQPPNQPAIRWLENWLAARAGRTVIYVGRDYDAAPAYWREIQPLPPLEQAAQVQEKRLAAEQRFDTERSTAADGASCDWFTLQKIAKPPLRVTTLSGPWSAGVNPAGADIDLYSQYKFAADDEALLASDQETIVARRSYFAPIDYASGAETSQLIVVTNGSFLLNFSLINHEHRKLAGHLIAEIPPGQRVVFLESGEGGPRILDSDPQPKSPNGLEVFAVWPLGTVLLHLAVAGVIFCFARYPIFGVPRDPAKESLSDFGKHVTAYAELLEATGDRQYARQKLEQYRQSVHKEGERLPA